MKILVLALLIVMGASQLGCAPLAAGAAGVAVGAAAERERQDDEDDD
jgi:hypothetical protein